MSYTVCHFCGLVGGFTAEPLHFEVLDKDTISTDDTIGSVLVSLKPLVCTSDFDGVNVIQGWFPIADSLRGICGEIWISIKLDFVGSSDALSVVRTFSVSRLPQTLYPYQFMLGLVEELLVRSKRVDVDGALHTELAALRHVTLPCRALLDLFVRSSALLCSLTVNACPRSYVTARWMMTPSMASVTTSGAVGRAT
jgi:hypothetical protein